MLAHLGRNAVAYLALFIALSGTAIAATQLPKNSVGAKQLKKQSVNAAKVKKNSLTGNQINEDKLGKVPEAAKLDGKVPGDFLAAGGTAVNADKLDGVHATIFGNTVTAAGMNFEPRESKGTEKIYVGPGGIRCENGTTDYSYRVQLPEGARITSVDYRYLDNAGAVTSSLALVAYDTFEQSAFLTETVATAASSVVDSPDKRTASANASNVPAAVVNNGRYSYQLNWSPFTCSASMVLVGGAVHYTLPTS